jgi:hypothetical protein
MPHRSRTPSYRRHKPSGQAVVTIDGHDHYLGRHDGPESRAEYHRLVGEWLAHGRRRDRPTQGGADLSVNELIVAFWDHVQGYYRHPDGTPTSEVDNFRLALRPCKKLYGHTRAADFDSITLETVRARMPPVAVGESG